MTIEEVRDELLAILKSSDDSNVGLGGTWIKGVTYKQIQRCADALLPHVKKERSK